MKKLLIMLTMMSVLTLSVFAADSKRNEENWTNLSYVNVPILKVMEANDGYLVLYQKNRIGTGRVVIPKAWIDGSEDSPRKLKFRNVKTAEEAYMSIMRDNGEFLRVVLNMPVSKQNPIWGVVGSGVKLEGTDKETLEDLDF